METYQFKDSDRGAAWSEDQHQAAVIEWAGFMCGMVPVLGMLFAIPNGGRRDPRTAAMLKRTGVKAGVPDLFLPAPAGRAAGLWIEMKKRGGRVDPAQRVWHEKLRRLGYRVAVCYGADAAIRCIGEYVNGAAACVAGSGDANRG